MSTVRELGIIIALAIVVAVTALVNPLFLSGQGIRDLLLNACLVALLTVGQTMVVITRNVDLSVGSVLGLSAFVTADTFAVDPALAIVVGIVVGALCGLVNGALVGLGRVPSLVVTLGTLSVFRGLDFMWAHGRQINAANLPDGFLALGSGSVFGLPYLVIITVLVLAVAALHLGSYRSGRELYAIGSNPEAAVLVGIPVGRRVFTTFLVSGTVAGLAGVLAVARYGTVDATVGTGLELQVISAVVVGGVAIFGGSGTVVGAALGALLLSTIGSALEVVHIAQFWQQAITGALLIAAIALDRSVALRVAARLRRQSRGVSA